MLSKGLERKAGKLTLSTIAQIDVMGGEGIHNSRTDAEYTRFAPFLSGLVAIAIY